MIRKTLYLFSALLLVPGIAAADVDALLRGWTLSPEVRSLDKEGHIRVEASAGIGVPASTVDTPGGRKRRRKQRDTEAERAQRTNGNGSPSASQRMTVRRVAGLTAIESMPSTCLRALSRSQTQAEQYMPPMSIVASDRSPSLCT